MPWSVPATSSPDCVQVSASTTEAGRAGASGVQSAPPIRRDVDSISRPWPRRLCDRGRRSGRSGRS